jgi:hypothetical protein
MDCQSGYPLNALISLFSRSRPACGMPGLGQCLHVGIGGRTRDRNSSIHENTMIPIWPNECNL